AKLLRALQEGEIQPVGAGRVERVDVRIVACTNRDLSAEVKERRFREDLYYRLAVVELVVPPLKEHTEDIPALAAEFAHRYADRFGMENVRLSPTLVEALRRADWPGNVRQLENTVARLVALHGAGGEIGGAARVLHVSSSPLSRQIHQLEEDIGVQLLARVGRRVQLTEAGKVFQREARETLARIDRAIATAQAASRGEVGRLRVAFVEVRRIAESIPPAVRQFRARHPHVTVELVPMRMREQLEAFDTGRIDA